VKLDIRDFFETIDERQVYEVFVEAGYQPLVSLELARLCTRYAGHAMHIDSDKYRASGSYMIIERYTKQLLGFLPQGAPTSGALANQVARGIDKRLTLLAKKYGAVYTRYADDMTFSSASDFNRKTAVNIVRCATASIRKEGFIVHGQKTKIVPPGARKIVLGLLVDGDKLRLNKKMRARLTNHVWAVDRFGLTRHVQHANFSSIDGFVHHISGLLAFASDIDPDWSRQIAARWDDLLRRDKWKGSI
jgi:Reverse transcriptase (RNA-dependent DNA polymerase).